VLGSFFVFSKFAFAKKKCGMKGEEKRRMKKDEVDDDKKSKEEIFHSHECRLFELKRFPCDNFWK
jgi:hypothetical protein